MANLPKCEGTCTIGFGVVQITNVSMPHEGFNPMGKLWASIRRENRRKYGVNVTAIFLHDEKDNLISCSLCLDYGYQLAHDIDQRAYEQRFMDTFEGQLMTLEKTLEAFVGDNENGYTAYLDHVEKNGGIADEDYCNEMFNRFLRGIGLKKPEDEQAKKEFREKFEEASKHALPPMFNL